MSVATYGQDKCGGGGGGEEAANIIIPFAVLTQSGVYITVQVTYLHAQPLRWMWFFHSEKMFWPRFFSQHLLSNWRKCLLGLLIEWSVDASFPHTLPLLTGQLLCSCLSFWKEKEKDWHGRHHTWTTQEYDQNLSKVGYSFGIIATLKIWMFQPRMKVIIVNHQSNSIFPFRVFFASIYFTRMAR